MIVTKYTNLMNKKQQQIYNWLLEHPGYLKSGFDKILEIRKWNDSPIDLEIALKQAKLDHKSKVNNSVTAEIVKEAMRITSKDVMAPLVVRKGIIKPFKQLLPKSEVIIPKTNKSPLKRLYFDLETSPNIVYSWNVGYKLNIGYENIIKERAIICACYKWEGSDDVGYLTWNDGDDGELVYRLYDILMSADEVVGHNGDNYDLKWFRTRCLFHGIMNMPDIKSIDTLKLSRKSFRFNSNRLDYIGQFLKLGKKMETGGFDLWKRIVSNNDQEAIKKMVEYCMQDVELLEKVYNKLSGYSKAKTHVGVLNGKSPCSCPKCASEKTYSKGNIISSLGTVKKKMQCMDCGSYFTISTKAYESRD